MADYRSSVNFGLDLSSVLYCFEVQIVDPLILVPWSAMVIMLVFYLFYFFFSDETKFGCGRETG